MVLRRIPTFARSEDAGRETRPERSEALRPASVPWGPSASKIFRTLELTHWLVDVHGLDPEHAEAMAQRLLSSAPSIRGAFYRWWKTGVLEELEIEGYGLRRLVEDKGMSVLGALLTLSLLARQGETTREELDRREAGEIHLEEAVRRLED